MCHYLGIKKAFIHSLYQILSNCQLALVRYSQMLVDKYLPNLQHHFFECKYMFFLFFRFIYRDLILYEVLSLFCWIYFGLVIPISVIFIHHVLLKEFYTIYNFQDTQGTLIDSLFCSMASSDLKNFIFDIEGSLNDFQTRVANDLRKTRKFHPTEKFK